jgi:hypothetical protein
VTTEGVEKCGVVETSDRSPGVGEKVGNKKKLHASPAE